MKRGFLLNHGLSRKKNFNAVPVKSAAAPGDAGEKENVPVHNSGPLVAHEENLVKIRCTFWDKESDLDLHSPPSASLVKRPQGKTRFIFRQWPRLASGQPLRKDRPFSSEWKMTPNGAQLWGATLYDFYRVQTIPDCKFVSSIGTSSRLAEAMRALGEVETCRNELEWAAMEPNPTILKPFDINILIDNYKSLSPNDPKRVPPTLQQPIPYHLLPSRLIVHDPDDCLSVRSRSPRPRTPTDEDMENPDLIRTYKLHLSTKGEEKFKKSFEQAEASGSTLPTFIEETHVYIGAHNVCGTGHHSVVYNVDWELPRWLFSSKANLSDTARVRVVFKLSHQYDDHLANEASQFQDFPRWFFEHWSGYNVIPPLHDPAPCTAITPQFYGYYHPVDPTSQTAPDTASTSLPRLPKNYLSPILLLENCGSPIELSSLNPDDRVECTSLFLHLCEAGVEHNSIYVRNILVQPGPLTVAPAERKKKSFRLIDFGGAERVKKWSHEQEGKAIDMFDPFVNREHLGLVY